MACSLLAPTMMTEIIPIKNISDPNSPKKCIGLMPNLERNQREIRSDTRSRNGLVRILLCRIYVPGGVPPFTDFLLESGVLCQIRYITMHLTVHFDMFYDLFAIGFQSAVEVVQDF